MYNSTVYRIDRDGTIRSAFVAEVEGMLGSGHETILSSNALQCCGCDPYDYEERLFASMGVTDPDRELCFREGTHGYRNFLGSDRPRTLAELFSLVGTGAA
jgi:hypothetical protein